MAAKKGPFYEITRGLHNLDEIFKIATGAGIFEIGKNVNKAWGPEIKKNVREAAGLPPVEDPYRVLHCHPEDYDIVIKGRFRNLVKDLHPDTGTHPDPKEFQRVTEAYNAIMKQRGK